LSNLLRPLVVLALAALPFAQQPPAVQKSPGAGAIIVFETVKGNIEFETYPEEAPKTVAHVIALVKKNFYNGLRFHRAESNFLVQVGDPTSRDMSRMAYWGRQGSGTPIGLAEITKKRKNVVGAVGMAHSGDPKTADSQIYITRRAAPDLDGKYTVFGKVLKGMDVVGRIQKGDVLKRAYLKDEAAKS
jgi:cyclophilin family peptidyl-prolyl cis-trans isomerase